MAIQFAYTDPYGVHHDAAYAVIADGSWSKKTGIVAVGTDVYADAIQAGAERLPLFSFSISFPIDLNAQLNMFQQAYAALKLDPVVAAGNPIDV